MTMRVNGPDGIVGKFPDGTDKETINRVMTEVWNKVQAQKNADPSRWGMFPEAMDTITMGGMSKLNAAGGGLIDATIGAMQGEGFDYSENYNRQLEQQRADQAAYEAQNPKKAFGGKVAGLALGVTSLPTAGTGFAGSVGTGAMYGGAGGALQDADSWQDRAINTAIGGGVGGAIGALAYPVAKGAAKLYDKAFGPAKTPLPTTEQLRDAKNLAYGTAETEAGLMQMTPDEVTGLAQSFNQNVGKDTNARGVLSRITGKPYAGTNKVISDFNEIASDIASGKSPPPTLAELEKMRQALNAHVDDAILPNGKLSADGAMTARLVDEIDDALLNTPFEGPREAYRTYMKSGKIDRAFYRAELSAGSNYTQAGMEKAIRGEFKQLANDRNFKRTFTQQEQDLILKVVKGSSVQNLFMKFGALAPKGGLSIMFNIGMTAVNPVVGIPLGVGATAAKYGSTATTIGNARMLDEMVKRSGQMLPNQVPQLTNRIDKTLMPPAILWGSDMFRSSQNSKRQIP